MCHTLSYRTSWMWKTSCHNPQTAVSLLLPSVWLLQPRSDGTMDNSVPLSMRGRPGRKAEVPSHLLSSGEHPPFLWDQGNRVSFYFSRTFKSIYTCIPLACGTQRPRKIIWMFQGCSEKSFRSILPCSFLICFSLWHHLMRLWTLAL